MSDERTRPRGYSASQHPGLRRAPSSSYLSRPGVTIALDSDTNPIPAFVSPRLPPSSTIHDVASRTGVSARARPPPAGGSSPPAAGPSRPIPIVAASPQSGPRSCAPFLLEGYTERELRAAMPRSRPPPPQTPVRGTPSDAEWDARWAASREQHEVQAQRDAQALANRGRLAAQRVYEEDTRGRGTAARPIGGGGYSSYGRDPFPDHTVRPEYTIHRPNPTRAAPRAPPPPINTSIAANGGPRRTTGFSAGVDIPPAAPRQPPSWDYRPALLDDDAGMRAYNRDTGYRAPSPAWGRPNHTSGVSLHIPGVGMVRSTTPMRRGPSPAFGYAAAPSLSRRPSFSESSGLARPPSRGPPTGYDRPPSRGPPGYHPPSRGPSGYDDRPPSRARSQSRDRATSRPLSTMYGSYAVGSPYGGALGSGAPYSTYRDEEDVFEQMTAEDFAAHLEVIQRR